MSKSKKKNIKKNVTTLPLTNESTIKSSKVTPNSSTKGDVIVKEVKKSNEEKLVEKIVLKVVKELKPDVDLKLEKISIDQKENFEAIKGNVINEMNDLRNMVETKIPTILEQQQISPDQAIPPSNQIRGVENNDATRHPETQGGMDKSSILPMLMQVLPSLLQKTQAASAEPTMENMIVQMMMKKMIGDMGKAESQSTAITNYLLKLMIKKDPSIMSAITDETPTPHNEDQ
jgi:hypothetical protein